MPRKVRSPTDPLSFIIQVPNMARNGTRSRKRRIQPGNTAAARPARRITRADNSSDTAFADLSQMLPHDGDAQEYEEPSSSPVQLFQQQGRMPISTFVCLLENKAHERCIAVSSSSRGAQCIAIASPKPGSQNTLLVTPCFDLSSHSILSDMLAVVTVSCAACQGQAMEHVLCIPMAFADEAGAPPAAHMVYLCSCEEMHSVVEEIAGLGLEARGTYTGMF